MSKLEIKLKALNSSSRIVICLKTNSIESIDRLLISTKRDNTIFKEIFDTKTRTKQDFLNGWTKCFNYVESNFDVPSILLNNKDLLK